jgi:hypothetical protein
MIEVSREEFIIVTITEILRYVLMVLGALWLWQWQEYVGVAAILLFLVGEYVQYKIWVRSNIDEGGE